MNINKLPSYRINNILFLVGLLLLMRFADKGWRPLLDALDRIVATTTITQAPVRQAAAPALLLLQADALVLPINTGTTPLTARVRDAQGKPVAGVTVQFQGGPGNVTPASATTDANGVAMTTFQATGTAGRALVTATTNGLSREAALQVVNPATSATTNRLTLDFGAGQLDPGQTATIHAVLRDAAGQPVAGELVTLFGSLGELTPANAMSDANGSVTASYRAGSTGGAAMITALAGVAAESVTFQISGSGTPNQLTAKAFLPLVSR